MKNERKELSDKITTIEHIATDQGNGAAYCGNCQYTLGTNPFIDYESCPKCDYKFNGSNLYVQQGGSDF